MADKYIDFSATNDGDGTTAAQAGAPGGVGAFNTIVGHLGAGGDSTWLRRAGSVTLGATLTFNVASVNYIGWPISTDEDYAGRPASGTTNGWDADSDSVFPEIIYNLIATRSLVISTGASQVFKRMLWTEAGVGSVSTASVASTVASNFRYMKFDNTNQNGTGQIVSALGTTGNYSFKDCNFISANATQSINHNAASTIQIFDCVFSKTAQAIAGSLFTTGTSSGGGEVNRCTFTIADTTKVSTTCLSLGNNAAGKIIVFNDCTCDNSAASSFSEAIIVDTTGGAILNNMSIKGASASLGGSSVAKAWRFSQILQTMPISGGPLNIAGGSGGSICYAANLTAFPGNATADVTAGIGAFLMLNNPIFSNITKFSTSTSKMIMVGDLNNSNGVFYAQNPDGTVRSNAVSRTGGETYSLRFDYGPSGSSTFFSYNPLEVGLPGFETIYSSLVSGANIVTMYGAYKGYAVAPTNDDVWFETVWLNAASGGAVTTTSSKANTALTSDTSVWVGEDNYTAFKIVLNITTGQACTCPIRIKMSKNDPNGWMLIDPTPVVT